MLEVVNPERGRFAESNRAKMSRDLNALGVRVLNDQLSILQA